MHWIHSVDYTASKSFKETIKKGLMSLKNWGLCLQLLLNCWWEKIYHVRSNSGKLLAECDNIFLRTSRGRWISTRGDSITLPDNTNQMDTHFQDFQNRNVWLKHILVTLTRVAWVKFCQSHCDVDRLRFLTFHINYGPVSLYLNNRYSMVGSLD